MADKKEIIVPQLGESVSEATIAVLHKKVGDTVKTDELIVELETDKVTLEVNAPADGVISALNIAEGDNVKVGDVIGVVAEGAVENNKENQSPAKEGDAVISKANTPNVNTDSLSPAPRKIAADNNVNVENISGSGKDGRVTKGDVLNYINNPVSASNIPAAQLVERVRMSKLRQKIAERLKESQNTAAILTTFNEVDLTEIMALRNQYKDQFLEKFGVKLGFMSFFVKASIEALKAVPAVNAEIEGTDVIYKNFYDIGVAVGTPQGLVVPVLRGADKLSIAGIEQGIMDLAIKARDGKLAIEDLTGGSFTISNGGVYGSLLSTPIINPPQSGILGMHKTQDRPMVVNGEIKIRPMMYLALSYDHRIIDGKEAVTFLVKLKEILEDPRRLILGL
jgi:2-oxoglutarate dehydrogenase E2 component (dihydrolipoamide succinyltransferase)